MVRGQADRWNRLVAGARIAGYGSAVASAVSADFLHAHRECGEDSALYSPAELPWRPGQRTLAQQVDMQMWHTFTRIGTAVNYDTIALGQLQLLCHIACDQ